MDGLAGVLEYVSFAIGMVALVIIIWGVIVGIIEMIRTKFTSPAAEEKRLGLLSKVRNDLGYHLLIALEFLIAADIIRTIVKPTLQELGILGATVAIRVVLSYFLHREISHKM